jgi:hypothetical protein
MAPGSALALGHNTTFSVFSAIIALPKLAY